MALDTSSLNSALLSIMDGSTPLATAADAGDAWADAYDAFAKTGTAGGVQPTVPPASTEALRAALGGQFTVMPGTPAGAAAGIAAALDSYWPTTVFVGQASPPVPGGGAVLISTLTTIFSTVGGTHASKTSEIVTALQAYTNAVIVSLILPPTTPFPVI